MKDPLPVSRAEAQQLYCKDEPLDEETRRRLLCTVIVLWAKLAAKERELSTKERA